MSTNPDLPDVVGRALATCLRNGFLESTTTETGRVLAALAATRTGTIAECGTGYGVGAAWLRSGAPARTRVLTAEREPRLAKAAAKTFADDDIEVVAAGWDELAGRAPFSLISVDAQTVRDLPRTELIDLTEPGGMIVIDNFSPSAAWPPMGPRGSVDALRMEWLTDPRLVSADLMVTHDTSLVVAVRRP